MEKVSIPCFNCGHFITLKVPKNNGGSSCICDSCQQAGIRFLLRNKVLYIDETDGDGA